MFPSPSSNRTYGFPVSGFPADTHGGACTRPRFGHAASWRLRERRVSVSAERSTSTSSVLGKSQSARLPSYSSNSAVGALCSTGITPHPRSYGPLRLPTQPPDGYVFPSDVAEPPAPRRVSQAPRLICPRALSPLTPAGPMGAHARCFPIGGGLHLFRQAGRPRLV